MVVASAGPQRIIETANFDEWIESVAADRASGWCRTWRCGATSILRSVHTFPTAPTTGLAGLPATSGLDSQFVGGSAARVSYVDSRHHASSQVGSNTSYELPLRDQGVGWDHERRSGIG